MAVSRLHGRCNQRTRSRSAALSDITPFVEQGAITGVEKDGVTIAHEARTPSPIARFANCSERNCLQRDTQIADLDRS